jgi:hypothetical protein
MEIVALISNGTSGCELQKHNGDDFDTVTLRCGNAVQNLGNASKGVTVDRLSGCHIMVHVAAVRQPRLLSINNCGESVEVADVGQSWTKQLQRSNRIKPGALEYVSYSQIPERAGCYNVEISYDQHEDSANSPFNNKNGTFCVPLGR